MVTRVFLPVLHPDFLFYVSYAPILTAIFEEMRWGRHIYCLFCFLASESHCLPGPLQGGLEPAETSPCCCLSAPPPGRPVSWRGPDFSVKAIEGVRLGQRPLLLVAGFVVTPGLGPRLSDCWATLESLHHRHVFVLGSEVLARAPPLCRVCPS